MWIPVQGHLSVYSFITFTLIFFYHGANNGTAALTKTGISKGSGRIIFYFVPANNWQSHVKYRMADLIQWVALLVAKIYTRVPVVEAERTLMIKTLLCQIQSLY